MLAIGLIAIAFATVIAAGTAAVAVNDGLERWWARRQPGRDGGSGRSLLPHRVLPGGPLPSGAQRPGVLVEHVAPRAAARGGWSPMAAREAVPPGRRPVP